MASALVHRLTKRWNSSKNSVYGFSTRQLKTQCRQWSVVDSCEIWAGAFRVVDMCKYLCLLFDIQILFFYINKM